MNENKFKYQFYKLVSELKRNNCKKIHHYIDKYRDYDNINVEDFCISFVKDGITFFLLASSYNGEYDSSLFLQNNSATEKLRKTEYYVYVRQFIGIEYDLNIIDHKSFINRILHPTND